MCTNIYRHTPYTKTLTAKIKIEEIHDDPIQQELKKNIDMGIY